MSAATFDQRAAAVLDGSASADDYAVLEATLDADPAAFDRFVRIAEIHATLGWELQYSKLNAERGSRNAEASEPTPKPIPIYRKGYEPKPFKLRTHHYALVAAALLAACGLAAYLLTASVDPKPDPIKPDQPGPAVATLIENTGDLQTPHGFTAEGNDYSAGEYTLSGGGAEFMLTNAVNVKLRGDTRMVMHNDMNVSLTRGAADFVVPRGAKGFTVTLPDHSRIVDLGTRFAVDARSPDRIEFRVVEGSVTWHHSERSEIVYAGQIVRIENDRVTRLVELGPRKRRVAIGPLRDGGFDIGFDWPPDNPSQFMGVDEASGAWVETVDHPRVRLFSDDRLIGAHSPPTYAELMSGDESGGAGVSQVVRTQPGVQYELVVRLARSGATNTPAVVIDVLDRPSEDPKPGDLCHERITIDWLIRSWREHRVRFTAASHTTTIRIHESLDSPTRGTSPLIDSIALTALESNDNQTNNPIYNGPSSPLSSGDIK